MFALMLAGVITLGITYVTGMAVTRSYLMRELMNEKRFHIANPSQWSTVSQGVRREPLKIAEAEEHAKAVRLAASHYSRLWPHTLVRLRKPLEVNQGLTRSQEIALNSQRVALQVKLMRKGLEDSPLMLAASEITSDKEFARANELVDSLSTPNDPRLIAFSHELTAKAQEIAPQAITLLGSKALHTKKGDSIQLPYGYSWVTWIENQKESFASMHIGVKDDEGEIVLSDDFYLSVRGTTEKEMKNTSEDIKKTLVNRLNYIQA